MHLASTATTDVFWAVRNSSESESFPIFGVINTKLFFFSLIYILYFEVVKEKFWFFLCFCVII